LKKLGSEERLKSVQAVLESAEFKLKEEALSYLLIKLRLPYELLSRGLAF
jgi:hypothetical protein